MALPSPYPEGNKLGLLPSFLDVFASDFGPRSPIRGSRVRARPLVDLTGTTRFAFYRALQSFTILFSQGRRAWRRRNYCPFILASASVVIIEGKPFKFATQLWSLHFASSGSACVRIRHSHFRCKQQQYHVLLPFVLPQGRATETYPRRSAPETVVHFEMAFWQQAIACVLSTSCDLK